MINRLRTMFLDNRTDLNDDVRAGQPNIIDEDAINTVRRLLEQVRVRVFKIEKYFQDVVCNPLLYKIILSIIFDHLGKKKNNARWVPKISTITN